MLYDLFKFCLTKRTNICGSAYVSIVLFNAGENFDTNDDLPAPALPCMYNDNGYFGVKCAFLCIN